MNRNTVLLVAFALVAFTSCKKVKTVSFDLNYQSTLEIVGSSQAGEDFHISTPDIATNTAQKFIDNNTSGDRVDSAFITMLKLTITFPAAENWDLIDTIGARLTAMGLTELTVVPDKQHTNDATKVYTFATSTANIKEFIKKDKFKARIHVILDENPLNNTQIDLEMSVMVYARENE